MTAVLAATGTILAGGVLASPAEPANAAPVKIVERCYAGTGYTGANKDWSGKNPKSCNGSYIMYDVSGRAPLNLVKIKNTKHVSFQKFVTSEYKAAQKWCSNNSFTCTLLSAVGFGRIAKFLRK
ncbi:hypothetical protein P9139_09290 [Curtobacterium flaccumfaciens]|nr:hypothetical protein P9139_09290 [Curtobacterium flaccumfaciens]